MIDERTGRPFGDHGTASQAIDFVLDPDNLDDADPANQVEFLRAWREGGAAEEWPEYYQWLAEQEAAAQVQPEAIGRTELTGGTDA